MRGISDRRHEEHGDQRRCDRTRNEDDAGAATHAKCQPLVFPRYAVGASDSGLTPHSQQLSRFLKRFLLIP